MGKAEVTGVGHPGVGAGYPGADVQNSADLELQEPDVWLGARMSGRMARMSGLRPGCPARRFQISFGAEIFELGAEIDDFVGKI